MKSKSKSVFFAAFLVLAPLCPAPASAQPRPPELKDFISGLAFLSDDSSRRIEEENRRLREQGGGQNGGNVGGGTGGSGLVIPEGLNEPEERPCRCRIQCMNCDEYEEDAVCDYYPYSGYSGMKLEELFCSEQGGVLRLFCEKQRER